MPLEHYLGLNDPVASISHLAAAILVLSGAYFLYKRGRGDSIHGSALLIFSASLLFLFSASGVYHALAPGPWRVFFRRLDYAGIWIVIAGSATPVHVLLFTGRWRWGLTALFWIAAVTCLILIDVYFSRLPYWSIILAYVGVASLGVLSYARITARYGWKETSLLFLGCIAYAGGALIDYLDRPVIITNVLGAHELFHFLVILGAFMHWCFLYNWPGRTALVDVSGN